MATTYQHQARSESDDPTAGPGQFTTAALEADAEAARRFDERPTQGTQRIQTIRLTQFTNTMPESTTLTDTDTNNPSTIRMNSRRPQIALGGGRQ
jgi:hypothetical protein